MIRLRLWQVFGMCMAVVAVIFIGYEVVERVWLADVDPSVLHTLHLVRGLSATLTTAAVTTYVLLCQVDACAPGEAPPPVEGSLKARLQHVRLRTKLVVPTVFLAVLPGLGIGLFTIVQMRAALRSQVLERARFDTSSKATLIQEFIRSAAEDVRFLSQIGEVELFRQDRSQRNRRTIIDEIAHEFEVFSQGRKVYSRVAYIDRTGRELVAVAIENGKPSRVIEGELRALAKQGYVAATLALDPGLVYIASRQVEEKPGGGFNRVIHFASKTSSAGFGRGVVVLTVPASNLLGLIGELAPGTEAWLADQGGTYLAYAGPSEERRQAFSRRREITVFDEFPDSIASRIVAREDRAQPIEAGPALLTFAPLSSAGAVFDHTWFLLVGRPRSPIFTPIRQTTVFLTVVMVMVIVVAAMTGILVAHYITRPVEMLRRATRNIAAGKLSERVSVSTGDEIESLANDFNVMTAKLSEAQERLATWNVKLQQEVDRQTAELRKLQRGLARADRLSLIGQMTASIMHEVGNPLAAIKTKVQVAQDSEDVKARCETLLPEVMSEVDRLADVLRSFSRLAKLRDPRFEKVTLDEVVNGVAVLVRPELKRKGIDLRVDVSPTPPIRGDGDQLRQLLINFVLNAADAQPGGGSIEIAVAEEGNGKNPGSVVIRIADEGTGIAPDKLDRIWDPFFTTKDEGTGLGLAIARRIVDDHDGTVSMFSRPGSGTVVTVKFPGATD